MRAGPGQLAVTAVHCMTPVGLDAAMTAASVRAGIRRMEKHGRYRDEGKNPVTVARIVGIEHDSPDTAEHIGRAAAMCLEELLAAYDCRGLGRRCSLFLGASAWERPGPRYEEHCRDRLLDILRRRADGDVRTVARGNASLHFALEQAATRIASVPSEPCILGGIDSLLGEATLNWLESDGRLKSSSYGRHQGLSASEAVGFLIVEDLECARRAGKTVLARITAWGLAEEPQPRAAGGPGLCAGLAGACRAALDCAPDGDIRAAFGDLNGEESRAREWSIAAMRCLGDRRERLRLWKPAASCGDIGAASGAVMVGIVAQGFARGWVPSPALVFCSDDHGACGVLVMEKGGPQT
ncbi:MAG: 3-oxoacyl-ACP synthase [Syntrophaceae bacterium]|nr:3-oxoacyl-ACP synthase [Syntrophaceae bacterium]